MIDKIELSNFIEQVSYPEKVIPSKVYKILGVKWYGKGLFIKNEIKGDEIKAKLLYRVEKGNFLYNRLFAWKGSFSIITDSFDGCYVSNEFPQFKPKGADTISMFVNYFFRQEFIWNQIEKKSSGVASISRNRYKEKDFLKMLIRNFTSNEIRKVVNKLKIAEALHESLKGQLIVKEKEVEQLRQSILQEAVQGKLIQQKPTDEPASKLLECIKAEKQKLIAAGKLKKEKELTPITEDEIPFELPKGWVWCRLGEAGQINPRNDYDENKESSFIPMTLISSDFGVTPKFEIRKWKEIKSGFTHFAENDVAVAKITPCFENSKSGIFKGLINGIGAGTTELHVFRGNINYIIPEYVYLFFKTTNFLREGQNKMTGSAGQKRIPTDFIKNVLFPLPPFSEQHRIVAKVQQSLQMVNQLEQQVQQSQTQAQQLLQAVLKEAFSSKEMVYEENELVTMAAEK